MTRCVGIYLSTDKVFGSRNVRLVTCANAGLTARRRGFSGLIVVLSVVLALAAIAPAHAQSISAADLAGTWSVFQLATPPGAFVGADVRSYSGTLTFDATGTVTAGTLTDDQFTSFTVSGTLTVTAAGVVDGTLALDGGPATLDVREARLLLTKHTIVGASTILGSPGLFTFVKLEAGQPFTLSADLAGDWNYHEITPSNNVIPKPPAAAGDATWVNGNITFHQLPDAPNGCTEADLTLADGTVRAQRVGGNPQSFL
jgi:hypothetical protein